MHRLRAFAAYFVFFLVGNSNQKLLFISQIVYELLVKYKMPEYSRPKNKG